MKTIIQQYLDEIVAVRFCVETDCEVNEKNQFIYTSTNGKSHINLAMLLVEYKDWLIANKLLIELK